MSFVTFGNFKTQLGNVYSNHASSHFGKDFWIVKKEFRYAIDGDKNKIVIVPRGFLTDGATVPRLFWGLIPPWGKYGQAVVLHDYLCEVPGYWNYGTWEELERKDVDQIFNQAMGNLGVSSLLRKTLYTAVKLYTIVSKFTTPKDNRGKRSLEKEISLVYDQTGFWI